MNNIYTISDLRKDIMENIIKNTDIKLLTYFDKNGNFNLNIQLGYHDWGFSFKDKDMENVVFYRLREFAGELLDKLEKEDG